MFAWVRGADNHGGLGAMGEMHDTQSLRRAGTPWRQLCQAAVVIRLIVPSGMEACESLDGLESCARARSPSARGESGRLHYWWRGSEACIINHTVHALPGSRVVLALQPREGRKKRKEAGPGRPDSSQIMQSVSSQGDPAIAEQTHRHPGP